MKSTSLGSVVVAVSTSIQARGQEPLSEEYLVNAKLAEGKEAHAHLLITLEQSRLMWDSIQAETDNGNEWMHNPNQTAALTRTVFFT